MHTYVPQNPSDEAETHHKKMTQTSVVKLVIELGIPTTISMLITSLYNMVDTYFVGSAGTSAQGAISVLFTLQSIIQAVAYMLGHGSGTHVSKELADGDVKAASKYVSSAIFLGSAFGIVFLTFGLIFLAPFMRLLGSTETILPYAKDYGMWVLISCPFLICSLILNNNLRYEGKAFYAMIGLVSGAVINTGLDYLFVIVWNMNVFGAGLATAISQVISCVILFVMYARHAQSKISLKYVTKNVKEYLSIFKNGLPSLIRQALNSISSGLLNNLAGIYGAQIGQADATITAMGIVGKYSNFVMCVGMGISQGLQPVASYNYELKLYKRVQKALLMTLLMAFCGVAVLSLPAIIFPQSIVQAFQKDAAVIEIGTPALRYAMIGMLFTPVFIPLNMMLQSILKAGIASFLALLRSGLIFIPTLLVTCAVWKVVGIQIAQPLSDVITAVINLPVLIVFLTKKHEDDLTDVKINEQNAISTVSEQ